MKRILHIVGGMYPGGLENFIMNIYRNVDRDKVQFDVIVHSRRDGDHCNEIERLGGKVYVAPRKSKHPIKNFLEIKRIVKEGHYDVVERHSDNAFPVTDMVAAKMGGAKKRIYHSHSSNSSHRGLHKFFRTWMGWAVTDRFACSDNAGKWMFGKRSYSVVKNAIDISAYTFNGDERLKVRDEWNVGADKVYAHVGLYAPVKNHLFLIRVFEHIVKAEPSSKLLLIGEGGMREEMEALVKELNLEDKVILTGIRNDVPRLLQMVDLFMFPSIYEGLPLSVIEAQSAGLRALISDVITDEVCVTDLVTKLSLSEGEEAWAKKAMELSRDYERRNTYNEVADAGYDVKRLAAFYSEL